MVVGGSEGSTGMVVVVSGESGAGLGASVVVGAVVVVSGAGAVVSGASVDGGSVSSGGQALSAQGSGGRVVVGSVVVGASVDGGTVGASGLFGATAPNGSPFLVVEPGSLSTSSTGERPLSSRLKTANPSRYSPVTET